MASGSSVDLESTLWNENGTDWDGLGTVFANSDYGGNPGFEDPGTADCHITAASQARDHGIDAQVVSDVDLQPQPYQAPDVGTYILAARCAPAQASARHPSKPVVAVCWFPHVRGAYIR